MLAGSCCSQSLLALFWREGERGRSIDGSHGAERDTTEMYRNPFEPEAETSAIFYIGLHFGHNLVHVRLYRRQAQVSHSYSTGLE